LRSLAEAPDRKPARYVIVGGDPRGLTRIPVNLDDLADSSGGPMRDFVTYARTKNTNAMFGYALARRLRSTGITVNGAHPGIIKGIGLGREASRPVRLLGAAFNRDVGGGMELLAQVVVVQREPNRAARRRPPWPWCPSPPVAG
jgi:NAD(P)-dependent dehydrogenase (short-subunit alcohol dehydrogenase family)